MTLPFDHFPTPSARVRVPSRPNAPAGASSPRELWRYRGLVRALLARSLKVKYQRSVLGFLWTLVNPLLMIGVLALVFHYVVRLPIADYWAFLLSGYFVWNFVQQMLSTGTYVILEHAPLRRSVAFPSEVLIVSATLARLAEFAIELSLVLIALVLFHHHGVPPSLLLVPVLVLLQVLLALGLMMPIATLSLFYTDIQHALPAALLTLFYVSPVFYPAELVPESVRALYFLNPLAGLLTLFQQVLYRGDWPSGALLAGTAAAAVLLASAGYLVFHRYKGLFAEIL
ncbi:MAG: ABC transporter permease [Gemmatimonadota bacterium]